MKLKLLITGITLVFVFDSFGQAKLEVIVKNIREAKGTIRVGLFNSEESFLEKAVEGKVVEAAANEVKIYFEDVKPGVYGLSVIHDENNSGDLDSNILGLPKEGFAFGNNAMGAFGPPSFDKAKVELQGDSLTRQTILMKYL